MYGKVMSHSDAWNQVKRIIEDIPNLPTLPGVYLQIIHLTSNSRSSVRDISRVISADPALSSKILKLVNSAYYGFPRQISTITHALVILGFAEIRNIAFTISVVRTFWNSSGFEIFDREKFWNHSLGCALAAKTLAKTLRYRVSGKAFTVGLIHDIGKIILDQYMHPSFAEILSKVHSEQMSMWEAEKIILGFTHAEIGAYLARKWSLPEEIEEAIRYHHTPQKATISPELTATIHLSDILTRMKSVGSGGDETIPPIQSSIWDSLRSLRPDLNETYLQYIASMFDDELKRAQSLFSIFHEKRGTR